MTVQTEWHPPDQVPPVKPGNNREFVVAIRRAKNGKVYSFAAYYLNAYRLEYRDGCPDVESCPGPDQCDDGCPTTGWFTSIGDDDYDYLFQNLYLEKDDKVMGWCELPQWSPDSEKLDGGS